MQVSVNPALPRGLQNVQDFGLLGEGALGALRPDVQNLPSMQAVHVVAASRARRLPSSGVRVAHARLAARCPRPLGRAVPSRTGTAEPLEVPVQLFPETAQRAHLWRRADQLQDLPRLGPLLLRTAFQLLQGERLDAIAQLWPRRVSPRPGRHFFWARHRLQDDRRLPRLRQQRP